MTGVGTSAQMRWTIRHVRERRFQQNDDVCLIRAPIALWLAGQQNPPLAVLARIFHRSGCRRWVLRGHGPPLPARAFRYLAACGSVVGWRR